MVKERSGQTLSLKIYDHDYLQNFLLLFLSLLTAPIVKNSHTLAGIYLIFLKKCPGPSLKQFQYQIWTSVKDLKSNYQVRQILAPLALLLLIITLRFTCGERKIWSNIKKSRIIMTMILVAI